MSSVSTLPSPTSSRVSYLEWYLPLLSCPNHTRVIPDFIPSHALHFQSISSSLDPIYKILLLYPFVSSHHHLSKRSHLTTAVSSPGLSLVRFHVFQNKGADCGNAQNTPSCSYSIPNLSMSCSVVQGLAFLSNSVSYHTSPKCSSYILKKLTFSFYNQRKELTVIFSRSRCLLCTVSQSLRIFSLILFMSFSFSSLAEEASCSSSRSRIIRSRLALSRSMFKRSLLSMYMRAAVQRDRFFNRPKKGKKS